MSEIEDAEFREVAALSGTGALVPQSSLERLPAILTPEQARAELEAFQALKRALAQPGDFQTFTRNGQAHAFPKKRLVKNLAMAFRCSVEILKTDVDQLPGNHIGVRVVARATRLSGAYCDAVGGCSTMEKRFEGALAGRNYHDCVSTAETRATNRALLNLIGGGEVSAEEMAAQAAEDAAIAEAAEADAEAKKRAKELEAFRVAWESAGRPEGSGDAFLKKHGRSLKRAMAALAEMVTNPPENDANDDKLTTAFGPTDAQRRLYRALIAELGYDEKRRLDLNETQTGREHTSDMTRQEVQKVIGVLQSRVDARNVAAK